MPWSGPRGPFALRSASSASAIARASGFVSMTLRSSGPCRSRAAMRAEVRLGQAPRRQLARGHPLLEVRDRRLVELERRDGDGLGRRRLRRRAPRPASAAAPAAVPQPRKLRRFIAPSYSLGAGAGRPRLASPSPSRRETSRRASQSRTSSVPVGTKWSSPTSRDSRRTTPPWVKRRWRPGGSPSTKERTRARRSSKVSPPGAAKPSKRARPSWSRGSSVSQGSPSSVAEAHLAQALVLAGLAPGEARRGDRPAQVGGPHAVEPLAGQQRPQGRGLVLAVRGEGHVRPARQRPPLARRRLAVAHEPQLPMSVRRCHGGESIGGARAGKTKGDGRARRSVPRSGRRGGLLVGQDELLPRLDHVRVLELVLVGVEDLHVLARRRRRRPSRSSRGCRPTSRSSSRRRRSSRP